MDMDIYGKENYFKHFFSFFHLIMKVYILSIILSVPDSVSTYLDLLQYVCFPVSNLMIELFIIHHTDSMFGHISLLLSCGGYNWLGGELICITTLTMDKKKSCTNGHTKRAPLQGVHTYLYPCPLSCVSTNLILHISSRLLTSWEALCINRDLHHSGSIWFQGADTVSYQHTIWPQRKGD